jgi:hypothetical protein
MRQIALNLRSNLLFMPHAGTGETRNQTGLRRIVLSLPQRAGEIAFASHPFLQETVRPCHPKERGRVKYNRLPSPIVLSAQIVPPWASTMHLEM